MNFFAKRQKNAGIMAISLAYDGMYAASLSHAPPALPVLEFLSFYPKALQTWSVLLERLARETPARQHPCALLLEPSDYQLLAVEFLNVPAEELKNAMRWRLKDLLDYPSEEASFDILVVPGDVSAGGRNQSMLVVAATNLQVAQHQQLFFDAKLALTVIDIPEMAQRNFSALLEPAGRGLAMLSFDANGGLLTVTFGQELYLSRRLDITLQHLLVEGDEERNAVFGRISLELQRSLDHFDRQHNYITTAKLILAPLGEVAEKLRQFLSTNMYLPVEVLDMATVLNLNKMPELKSAEQQQNFFNIIGAALRQDPNMHAKLVTSTGKLAEVRSR